MTWRQMIRVGVRRVVLARGELVNSRHEGPKYAARRAEARAAPSSESKGAAGGGAVAGRGRGERRDRGRSDKRENDESGTTAGGGMKVAARIGERLRREIERGSCPNVGDG